MTVVSVPRGGRGMSRLASLSCQRAASTDRLARKTGFATMRKPIRTTRATRLNGADCAGVNAAVEPWDIGHFPVGSSLIQPTPILRLLEGEVRYGPSRQFQRVLGVAAVAG